AWRAGSLPKPFAAADLEAPQKFAGRHATLAFELDLIERNGLAVGLKRTGAAHQERVAFDKERAGLDCRRGDWVHAVDDQLLAAQARVRAGPGLEATPSVINLLCRTRKL